MYAVKVCCMDLCLLHGPARAVLSHCVLETLKL